MPNAPDTPATPAMSATPATPATPAAPAATTITLQDIRRRARRRAALAALALLLLCALAAGAYAWRFHARMIASLPQLDGEIPLPTAALDADITITRDALGVPTIHAATRADAARALGFLHAQDRFFQMDLARRRAAGELAELLGPKALDADKAVRIHALRPTARQTLAQLPEPQRALLAAYAAGVNAGLAHLRAPPFEYLLLSTPPRPWLPEDSILVIHAMALDLQQPDAAYERTLGAIRDTLGNKALAYFAPLMTPDDAALDTTTAPLPPIPGPEYINLRRPPAPREIAGPQKAKPDPFAEGVRFCFLRSPENPPTSQGSNSMALANPRGPAILENDMHLALRVPNTWYRASLTYPAPDNKSEMLSGAPATRAPTPDNPSASLQDIASGDAISALPRSVRNPHSEIHLTGITLPGAPAIVAGSNGHIAWGFTNSYADTSDIVILTPDTIGPRYYYANKTLHRTETRDELIAVRGKKTPVTHKVETSIWGPIVGENYKNQKIALKWIFHDPAAANYNLLDLETATNVDEALRIAKTAGIPAQNILIADAAGDIAWTICGRLPERYGYDGRLPATWSYNDRGWRGLLPPEKVPEKILRAADNAAATTPATASLSTANQRLLGPPALALLGDGGYRPAQRASRIQNLLARVPPPTENCKLKTENSQSGEAALLAIALDDHAPHLARWHQLLRDTLALPNTPAPLAPLRAAAGETWDDTTNRATPTSPAYPIVRQFRQHVIARILAPIFEPCADAYPDFNYQLLRNEAPVWNLLQQKPPHLLAPEYPTYDALLLAAAEDTRRDLAAAGFSNPATARWGAFNVSRIRHPLSATYLGLIGRLLHLDMPPDELPGDDDTPRVQHPASGASERFVVSPGRETEGIFHMPCGQSAHPLSPYYRAGHDAWTRGAPTPFLPGPTEHTLILKTR